MDAAEEAASRRDATKDKTRVSIMYMTPDIVNKWVVALADVASFRIPDVELPDMYSDIVSQTCRSGGVETDCDSHMAHTMSSFVSKQC